VSQQRLGHKNIVAVDLCLQALTNEDNPYTETTE